MHVVHKHEVLLQRPGLHGSQQAQGDPAPQQRVPECGGRHGDGAAQQGHGPNPGTGAQGGGKSQKKAGSQRGGGCLQNPQATVGGAAGGAGGRVLAPPVEEHSAVLNERGQLGGGARRIGGLTSHGVVPSTEGRDTGVAGRRHKELLGVGAGGGSPTQLALLGMEEDVVARQNLHTGDVVQEGGLEHQQLEDGAPHAGEHREENPGSARAHRHRVHRHVELCDALRGGAAAAILHQRGWLKRHRLLHLRCATLF
mmetsp:Transcript_36270/g.102508  ORF Transcript_36270/g.102508 Transcript_36270/m.102508 type:complete len:254 (+) Transcript_36270:230-991(+)